MSAAQESQRKETPTFAEILISPSAFVLIFKQKQNKLPFALREKDDWVFFSTSGL